MSAIYPLSPQGSAQDMGDLVSGPLSDLTGQPRFGLKGAGAADWFTAQGFDLPDINRSVVQHGVRLCRLGRNDVMVLHKDAGAVQALRAIWQAAPVSYSSWREESWAWLHLGGPRAGAVAGRLTAFDLRPGQFGPDGIAQTRFAHMDAVLMRGGDGLDIFFDISATAQVVRDMHAAIQIDKGQAQ